MSIKEEEKNKNGYTVIHNGMLCTSGRKQKKIKLTIHDVKRYRRVPHHRRPAGVHARVRGPRAPDAQSGHRGALGKVLGRGGLHAGA